jgi:ankyrin repeat protein
MDEHTDTFLQRKLARAIEESNLFEVGEALNAGADPLMQCDDGLTPFEKAARGSDIAALELMIALGVPIDWQDHEGRCLLHFCAEDGTVETAEFLLKNNANPALHDSYGDTPLHYAAKYGELELANLILATRDCTKVVNNAMKTALDVCRVASDVYPLLASFSLRKRINDVISGVSLTLALGKNHLNA